VRHVPFEAVALVLQGRGALGAYQAGVYEALAEADIHLNWIAGISIGAINAAIVAGNPPPSWVERLREFWTHVPSDGPWSCFDATRSRWARSDAARNFFNQTSASLALTRGARGFFSARAVMPWLQAASSTVASGIGSTAKPSDFCGLHTKKAEVLSISQ
jgi:NTE family protein